MVFFLENRLPEDISFGMSGGPQFMTEILIDKQGKEYRNILNTTPLSTYKICYKMQSHEQIKKLNIFFRICKGKAYGFRFKDYFDFSAKKQILGVGDGINKQYQLIKFYGNEKRKISKPVENKVIIYLDDLKVNASINYKNGEVVFEHPPQKGQVISADFEFDVPVRFNTDKFEAIYIAINNYSWVDIELIEIII